MHRTTALLILLLLIGLLAPAAMLVAQDNSIILTLAIPPYLSDAFTDEVFAEFEAENPGVKVVLAESGDEAYYTPAIYNIEEHLTGAEKYVATADVLYVNSYNFSVEATRAGLFLDLAPLASVDSTLNEDDFIPSVWQSFQWDGGIWALPVSASVQVLAYKPARFDEAGLAYPSESWTFEDFANAVRALSQTDSSGEVTLPGFFSFSDNKLLYRAFIGQALYDNSTIPNAPLLNQAAVEDFIAIWSELDNEGVMGRNLDFSGFDYNELPMRIDQSYVLSNPTSSPEDQWAVSLLPGGVAGLAIESFAVSGGTQYPEQSYALAKFLTGNVDIVNRFFSDSPARQSLIGAESDNDLGAFRNLTPEQESFIQDAIANAVPISELRFYDYVGQAIDRVVNEDVDPQAALQEVETAAVENLQTAADRRGVTAVYVSTPVPTPVLSGDEVAINFGYTAFISPIPNREAWDTVINDFVANDPQVGQVVFDSGFGSTLTDLSERYDCYYLPYNAVQSEDDLSPILSLDPFTSADATFDPNDLVGGALAQVQRNNQLWALPIVIQPQVLRYNSALFEETGVPLPEDGWSIDEFNDALRQLKLDPDDAEPFAPNDSGGTHLFILMAAYGGIPLDYRTEPITANFTDTATVDAIRQVLDLAKDGYIKYTELGNFSGGGGSFGDTAIYGQVLSLLSFYNTVPSGEGENPFLMTTYPTGNQFTGAAYDIGTAYISANSPAPEACYRWLSTIAQRPDLFNAMPARRSMLAGAELETAQGEDLTGLYQQYDALLSDPNTITLPSTFGGANSPGNYIIQLWLYRVFDSYVLKDGDLEVELAQAEQYVTEYQECSASIPPNTLGADATQREQINYFRQFTDCAVSIDASLESLFNFPDE
ncbi:MAG: extracellular solute-binding protein [Anaerolineae bacterium]|nr:extracellular solute-binding protein [Anaerolineae bacterium]